MCCVLRRRLETVLDADAMVPGGVPLASLGRLWAFWFRGDGMKGMTFRRPGRFSSHAEAGSVGRRTPQAPLGMLRTSVSAFYCDGGVRTFAGSEAGLSALALRATTR